MYVPDFPLLAAYLEPIIPAPHYIPWTHAIQILALGAAIAFQSSLVCVCSSERKFHPKALLCQLEILSVR